MEKLYWLILLSPMVGKESHPIGKNMQFPEDDYLELIRRGTAKPKNHAEYEELKREREEAKQAHQELKAKAIASIEQEKLKESAELLKKELESTLDLILDDEFKSSVNIGFVTCEACDSTKDRIEELEDVILYKNVSLKTANELVDSKASYIREQIVKIKNLEDDLKEHKIELTDTRQKSRDIEASYHALLEDLSLCTKIAEYKSLEKKYLTEEE